MPFLCTEGVKISVAYLILYHDGMDSVKVKDQSSI